MKHVQFLNKGAALTVKKDVLELISPLKKLLLPVRNIHVNPLINNIQVNPLNTGDHIADNNTVEESSATIKVDVEDNIEGDIVPHIGPLELKVIKGRHLSVFFYSVYARDNSIIF